jgi:maleamate amidohydrolase
VFLKKAPSLRRLVAGEPLAEIDPTIAPTADELVIVKQYPSCFFGTSLAATLATQRIDTMVLIGCSTSGCIRASAVDGVQHGFHVIVPRECVGDRHDGPHDANLFDIDAKYGDVLPKREVISYLDNRASAGPAQPA